ncbi:MAG: Pyridinium-3,5-biscarboxylic acid mononucleotide synthase [Phycisphaerae bacterium]|nr:Pyridinium-3,5-biscarboxylic acid mononucleotide synthase [Phycisphaerae bacterium]
MNHERLHNLLQDLRSGRVGVDDALRRMQTLPFEDLGFARVDHHRSLRCGFPEVIFGQGKTNEQICSIFATLAAGGHDVLATRVESDAATALVARFPQARHEPVARTVALRQTQRPSEPGIIGILCAGTSDLPVAEEARVTAELMSATVRTYYDVGVAGLHRLLGHVEELRAARALVVVAGMEGALASVVGGLVDVPVIAVPTSVGYGASFGGLAALLAMLNSCAAGVSVVNIDNGFGAAFQACRIARTAQRCTARPTAATDGAPAPTNAATGAAGRATPATGGAREGHHG